MKIKNVEALYYITLAYWTWVEDKDSILPKILDVFCIDDIKKLCFIFGGRTVKIPTAEELSQLVLEALVAYRISEGEEHKDIAKMFDNSQQYDIIKKKVSKFLPFFQGQSLPEDL